MQNSIDNLKDELRETLFLELDDFGLSELGNEVAGVFVGIRLRSEFQPIVLNQDGGVLGYEALLRPALGDAQPINPDFAFGFADQTRRLIKLDRLCRTLHMLNFLQLPQHDILLFLNVHPRLVENVDSHGKVYESILHAHSVPTRQVVIEIAESAIGVDRHLAHAVRNYQSLHYRIAIDNFGGARSSIDRLWRLAPDFVKLDRSLVQEAEHNATVARLLPRLVELIHAIGAQAIVQGIENATQLKIAQDSGAHALQGYWIGRPASVGGIGINHAVAAGRVA